MSYFPESIVPANIKQESADVLGNKYIVSAADYNKHDEEIRAIERLIGIRRANYPCDLTTISGVSQGSGQGGGSCQPAQTVSDILTAITNLVTLLENIRDNAMMVTSGCILKHNGNIFVDPTLGIINFPTDWPKTVLLQDLPDNRVDEEDPLDPIDSIRLNDVSGMQESGYITLINDVSTMNYQTANRVVHLPGYTSLATTNKPYFQQYDINARLGGVSKLSLPDSRVFGLGTNVEFISYAGLDTVNNKILNCQRMAGGSSATGHGAGDLVFKGRCTINIGPLMYKVNHGKTMDAVECVLRSNGGIDLEVRSTDVKPPDYKTQTFYAYVHYQALLVRDLVGIADYDPPLDNGPQGGCQ